MARKNISSGSPFEPEIGFSRATRIGPILAIAGTAPIAADGATAAKEDIYGQTRRCLEIVRQAVEEAGGSLEQIFRTRILLTDISRWQEAARAHGEIFSEIRPACTFAQVSAFIDPEWLVEVEADAYIEENSD